jgi:hypothetical protein
MVDRIGTSVLLILPSMLCLESRKGVAGPNGGRLTKMMLVSVLLCEMMLWGFCKVVMDSW